MALPYFPHRNMLIALSISTWITLVWIIMYWEPIFIKDIILKDSYLLFFILFFLAVYWSFFAISGRWKRTLLWTMISTTFLYLRMNQLDSFLNLVLLFSFGGIWEYYWSLINRSVK